MSNDHGRDRIHEGDDAKHEDGMLWREAMISLYLVDGYKSDHDVTIS